MTLSAVSRCELLAGECPHDALLWLLLCRMRTYWVLLVYKYLHRKNNAASVARPLGQRQVKFVS